MITEYFTIIYIKLVLLFSMQSKIDSFKNERFFKVLGDAAPGSDRPATSKGIMFGGFMWGITILVYAKLTGL